MIDIHTIGAGGGSIARVTEDGTLTVGPESAGAQPGPVCYGAGGEEPTVTDAHLVLGRIPSHLLGGEIALDVERRAGRSRSAWRGRSGCPWTRPRRASSTSSNNNMVGALRLVSVERGYDPRDFVLVPFGGAGPLHGADLAALLGMRTSSSRAIPACCRRSACSAPRSATTTPGRVCRSRPTTTSARVAAVYAELEGQARAWLAAEGVAAGRAPGHADGRPPLSPPGLRAHRAVARARPRPGRAPRALPRPPPSALHVRAGRRAGRDRHAAGGRGRARPALHAALPRARPRGARRARRGGASTSPGAGWTACPCLDARAAGRGRGGDGARPSSSSSTPPPSSRPGSGPGSTASATS